MSNLFKSIHIANVYWHKFVEDNVPMPSGFEKGKIVRTSYITNFEGSASPQSYEDYVKTNYMSLAYFLDSKIGY